MVRSSLRSREESGNDNHMSIGGIAVYYVPWLVLILDI